MKAWRILRNGILLMGTVILVLAFGGRIYAYLADAAYEENKITVGSVKVQVVENFDPDLAILEAGNSFEKAVAFKNTGTSGCYVRAKLLFGSSDLEECCEADRNTEDFVYNTEDGYYYYPKLLKSGKTTPDLITTVSVVRTPSTEDAVPSEIIVYAESIQAEPFPGYEKAWEAYKKNR